MMSELDEVRRNWDDKSAGWHRHIGAEGDANRRNRLMPVIRRWLGDISGQRALDAGCGTGWMTGVLAEMGAVVTGVDLSGEMIRIARRELSRRGLSVTLCRDDCSRLQSCETAGFDLVTSIYALQDLPDMDGALAAFSRVLKPGGRCLLAFSHPCFDAPGGFRRENDGVIYNWTGPYFRDDRYTEEWRGTDHRTGERFSFGDAFIWYHRPLHRYWNACRAAGFNVLELDEPYPADEQDTALPFPIMLLLEKM